MLVRRDVRARDAGPIGKSSLGEAGDNPGISKNDSEIGHRCIVLDTSDETRETEQRGQDGGPRRSQRFPAMSTNTQTRP